MAAQGIGTLDRETLLDLQTIPLFFGLPEGDLRNLLGDAWTETFPDGHVLFERGQTADRFFVVLDGHVELFLYDGARRPVLDIAERPAVLGEAAMLPGGQHPSSARVVGSAKILIVMAAPFLTALDERFDLSLLMLSSMSTRLRGLVMQITELKQKTTAQRLGGFLLGLTAQNDGPALVRFPYGKRLAAEFLGMSAESLSRAMARLAGLGVETQGDEVTIANMGALRGFCLEESD